MNQKSIRLTDWNGNLGLLALTTLIVVLNICAFNNPLFLADQSFMRRLVIYLGAPLIAYDLYKIVWFVEIGDSITFQKTLGKHTYEWSQLHGIRLEQKRKRIFLVPFTNEYLNFEMRGRRHYEYHSYRISKKQKYQLLELIELHSSSI